MRHDHTSRGPLLFICCARCCRTRNPDGSSWHSWSEYGRSRSRRVGGINNTTLFQFDCKSQYLINQRFIRENGVDMSEYPVCPNRVILDSLPRPSPRITCGITQSTDSREDNRQDQEDAKVTRWTPLPWMNHHPVYIPSKSGRDRQDQTKKKKKVGVTAEVINSVADEWNDADISGLWMNEYERAREFCIWWLTLNRGLEWDKPDS